MHYGKKWFYFMKKILRAWLSDQILKHLALLGQTSHGMMFHDMTNTPLQYIFWHFFPFLFIIIIPFLLSSLFNLLCRYLNLCLLCQVGTQLQDTSLAQEELIPGPDIKDTVECRTINKRNTNSEPCWCWDGSNHCWNDILK